MRPATLYLLSAEQAWGLVLGVLVFIALMTGTYLLFRWLTNRTGGSSGRRMKALDRLPLSKDSAIVIVQIGLRLMAVGVGRDGVRLICELRSGDFEEPEPVSPGFAAAAGFGKRFIHNLKINLRLAPKGTKPMGPGAAFPAGDDTSPAKDSFADILARIAQRENEQNPISGAQSAGESGRLSMEEPPRPAALDYQSRIDQMRRWSEPDALDRKARPYTPPAAPHASAQPMRERHAVYGDKPAAAYKSNPAPYTPAYGEKPAGSAPAYGDKPPQKPPAAPVPERNPEADAKIDMLLDMIAKRQDHYKKDGEKP